jgi:effector-binding domain-containing protein
MPKYHVEKSLLIDAPTDSVEALTKDFNRWPEWSPWLCMEPQATVSVHGAPGQPGHGYSWSGTVVGAGEMQTTAHDNGVHNMDLTFIKPCKSTAKVSLDIKPVGDNQTSVTWHMWSGLPFFMFFMTNTLKSMIGMDYERGLKKLKELAETGTVNSTIEVHGVVDIPETHYLGVSADSSMEQLGDSMAKTLPQAYHAVAEKNLQTTTVPAGAIYNDMNIKTSHCRYTAIIPLAAKAQADNSFVCDTIAAGKALKVTHTGSYNHLGNGWATAMAYQRHNKHKLLKSQPPFEFYLNDPEHTAEKDLITEIFIPVRG